MIWGKTYAQVLKDGIAQSVWEPWFAWHPVELLDGRWVWLETVLRKPYMLGVNHYKLPGEAKRK